MHFGTKGFSFSNSFVMTCEQDSLVFPGLRDAPDRIFAYLAKRQRQSTNGLYKGLSAMTCSREMIWYFQPGLRQKMARKSFQHCK